MNNKIEEKSKRSKILVQRALQLKYALVVLLAMLATAVTVGADFYIRLHSFIKEFLKVFRRYMGKDITQVFPKEFLFLSIPYNIKSLFIAIDTNVVFEYKHRIDT